MLSDKTKLQMIFIFWKYHCLLPIMAVWQRSVGSKDTIKVRLLQFIQTLLICATT